MKLAHYNDGKQKQYSHEISIKEDEGFSHFNPDVYSHNITDVTGFGETKEEALKDFKEKIDYLLCEYKAFEKMLFETDLLENQMIEVDCTGHEVKGE